MLALADPFSMVSRVGRLIFARSATCSALNFLLNRASLIFSPNSKSDSLASVRTAVAAHSDLSETYTGSGVTKYSDLAYPTSVSESEILTVTDYDNYDFTEKFFGLPSELNSSADGKIIPDQFTSVVGQVTGTKVKILGTVDDYIETVNFYDDRYRLIQSKVENAKGAEDVFSTQYDFTGKVRKTHQTIRNPESDIPYFCDPGACL